MTVNIPIGADPSAAVQAVNEIRAAMKALGMEGQLVSNIDLSKLGAADLAADLDKVVQNLRNLTKIGTGATAAAARQLFGKDPDIDAILNIQEAAALKFPDKADRNRFVSNVGRYAFNGTSFDLNRPPPAPPEDSDNPPPPPDDERPGRWKFKPDEGGGVWGGIKGGLLAGGGFALAQMGLGSIAGAASAAMSAGEGENNAVDNLLRRAGDLSTSFDALRRVGDQLHEGLLVNKIDFDRYAGILGQAAGGVTGSTFRDTRLAVGLANGFGADPAGFARSMGQASFMGMDPTRFAEMVGESAVRGSMGGRVEEVLSSMLRWTESASRFSGTRAALAGSMSGFDDLWTSMQASGSPALRGQNADSVIGQINNSIMSGGGGGMAGQVLVQRAMMRAGITDPYDIQMHLAGGAFARVGGDKGPTNYDVVLGELKREYGPLGANRAAIAAGNLFGINPQTAQALLGLDPKKHIDLKHLDDVLKPFGGIQGINPTGLTDIIRAENASPAALRGMRDQLLLQPGVFDDKTTADLLRNAKTPDELRNAVVTGSAKSGMTETDASRAIKAENDLTDQMAKIGGGLVNAMTDLKKATVDLLTPVAEIAEALRIKLRPAPDPNAGAAHGSRPSKGADAKAAGGNLQGVPDGDVLKGIMRLESGSGATSSNLFGLASAWLPDVKALAASDDDVKKQIAGLSDAGIIGLRDRAHSALQAKVAAYHLQRVRQKIAEYHMQDSGLGEYAVWNVGSDAPRLMGADDNALLDTVLSRGVMAENPEYRGHTVGWWKKTRGNAFSDTGRAPAAAPGTGGTHQVAVTPAAPIHVVLHTPAGQVHSQHDVDWHATPGTPSPSGVPNASNGY